MSDKFFIGWSVAFIVLITTGYILKISAMAENAQPEEHPVNKKAVTKFDEVCYPLSQTINGVVYVSMFCTDK